MDRTIFGRKALNEQRPRVDRFVAPRESFPEIRRRMLWSRCEQPTKSIFYSQFQQKKNYMNFLDDAFGLEPLKLQKPLLDSELQDLRSAWPCVPRKKSYLSSNNSILLLDLPTYGTAPFPELLDWSNDNILVAALGRHFYKWSWSSQSLVRRGFTQNEIFCCKFDPKGELLLLGTDFMKIEIHDNKYSKWVSDNFCQRCLRTQPGYQPGYCYITAIDWSPTGNSYVTGCSRGILSSFSRNSLPISSRHTTRGAVLTVKVSPDARYVAAAAVNRNAVEVLTWPHLQLYSKVCLSIWTIKALSWHPWRSALLCIGTAQNRIGLWNAPNDNVWYWDHSNNFIILDTMLFSQRTGELVLTVWDEDIASATPKTNSTLLVMSDPQTVVDQWGDRAYLDRVRTMVFSPDGTKLATATAGEDLIIWNFLPEDKIKKKMNNTKFCKIPVYLDEATDGFSLR